MGVRMCVGGFFSIDISIDKKATQQNEESSIQVS